MLRPGSLADSLRDLRQVVAMAWAPVLVFFFFCFCLMGNMMSDFTG